MAEDFLSSSRTRSIAGALLLLLFVALYIVLLGERPLFIPDEMRYGEIPREMLATGDWIVPYLDGLLYFEKPPFGYWLNAMWLWVFGETEFAVRFSSALTTGLSAALVFAVCRALFFSRSVAYVAAFVFLTTLEVQAVGTYSVLDPTFALALNAGIFLMALAAYGEGVRRTALFAGAGVVLGVAFLTKGFLAFVLPVIVIGPWFIIRRQYGLLFRDAWISVVCAVAVVLPWAVAIHLREPDFWHYFIWVEHIKRFAADNAQHKEAFWFFVVLLPALAFPWIFLSPVALRGVRDNVRGQCRDGAVSLLVLWAAVPFLFFTVASGKLPTYILPCFLPFSALMAAGLVHSTASIRSVRLSLGAAVIAILVFSAALYVYATNAT
jgi:4-amino-4-deoxy-L-arabinose transferase